MSLATLTHGEGKPLVLVHGWGMHAGVWMPLLPRLEKRWRVTMIELPGHGESDFIQGDVHHWARALLESAPETATWLGWSLGAMVSLAAAAEAPERFGALVLAGGTPRFVREPGWECGMQKALLNSFADELFSSPERTMLRFLGLQVRGAENERETLKELRSGVRQRPQARREALRSGLDLLLQTELRPHLSGLRVPSLWLFGEKDTLVSAKTADHLRRLQPLARTRVIRGAGHAPFLSHPEACLEVLEEEA
ncbi:MAG: pimeloyl-ACP methyl ester esterase BioH [Chromatiales bacterium]|jgi:pimeloyl-[acyl-carrier protein] methyl ester esterase